MPYSLWLIGEKDSIPAQTASTSEWKIFQNLRKSTGGISGLLLLFFCISFYAGLFNHHRSGDKDECWVFLVWIYTYTSLLFAFRLVHEVSILRWKKQIKEKKNFQMSLLVFNWLHVISVPLIVITTVIGYVILSGSVGNIDCIDNDVLLLATIFLTMSIPVFGMKWFLFCITLKSGDLHFLSRSAIERHYQNHMSPQFLTDENGSIDNSGWTMTFPVIENTDSTALCTICLDSVPCGGHIRDIPCGHKFHQLCIDRWLLDHTTCPICLRTIKQSTIIEGYHRRQHRPIRREEVSVEENLEGVTVLEIELDIEDEVVEVVEVAE
tara:strand:+ start:206 stop:1174 length:969 start_codon:yes stop_codon:yes gene_type:complete